VRLSVAELPSASDPSGGEIGGDGACDRYRVDMTAARFGDCVCGKPKAAHSDAAQHAQPTGSSTTQAALQMRVLSAPRWLPAPHAAEAVAVAERHVVKAPTHPLPALPPPEPPEAARDSETGDARSAQHAAAACTEPQESGNTDTAEVRAGAVVDGDDGRCDSKQPSTRAKEPRAAARAATQHVQALAHGRAQLVARRQARLKRVETGLQRVADEALARKEVRSRLESVPCAGSGPPSEAESLTVDSDVAYSSS
jgi:hypothetical protein